MTADIKEPRSQHSVYDPMKSEQVLAIPTDRLWSILPYVSDGIITDTSESTLMEILRYGIFERRDLLEMDESHKQIIPYAVITCGELIYLFHRTNKQTEKRLHNLYSLGVGGHMNPWGERIDIDYLKHELSRELLEEVTLFPDSKIESLNPIGYINDDSNDVGRVHLGILFEIRLNSTEIEIHEKEKMTGKWIPSSDFPQYYPKMESWSRIYIDLKS